MGRLFQDDLLFPHMTVGENILFSMPRGNREKRLAAMRAALIAGGLEGLEGRPPFRLSGGQRARVALLRALMAKPDAMLLDEPFNKLDAALRDTIRNFVFGEIAERGIPCLLVTHDRADVPDYCTVLDTLLMARERHPGQRNNLDALCKRYGVDNSGRELHGALLDAEILADVYLAMTGGQTSLSLAGNGAEGEGGLGQATAIRRLAADRVRTRVLHASAEELAAHASRLAVIEKSSGAPAVWTQLEADA